MNGSRAALAALGGLAMSVSAHAGPVSDNAIRAEELQAAGDPVAAEKAWREAYAAFWAAGPLFLRRAVLVRAPAAAFGVFEARDDNVFSNGEPIRLYIEPAGYGFARSKGGFDVSFQIDAEIVSENATTIWGRRDIHRFGTQGALQTFEYFETLTLNLEGLPNGRYTIRTTLTDRATGKTAEIETPVRIE